MNLTAEDFIARFMDGGWDSLATVGRAVPDPRAPAEQGALDAIAGAAARLYATPDGRAVIEHLVALTLTKASWHGVLGQSVDQIASYGLLREGQNSIVAALLGLILKGRGEATASRDAGA